MKKYHIADLLTLSRILLAVAIFIITLRLDTANNWLILLLFSVGELTDAFDGYFARRYHYPKDFKYRFWRAHNDLFDIWNYQLFDIIADLMLGIAVLIYLTKFVSLFLGAFLLGGAIGVGCFVTISVKNDFAGVRVPNFDIEDALEEVILRRRRWYLAVLALIIVVLILTAKGNFFVKLLLLVVGAFIGLILINKKENRLTQDKTPL